MQSNTPRPADLLEVGETYAMFTSGSNEIRQATIEDHIIVDRGFTCASIYMVQANGEKFMVVRPKKHEFFDSKGKRYTFMEMTK